MAEKILNKLKEIWAKIVEWWNKFTSKQKTGIIALAVGVVVAFVILYTVLTAPNYVNLKQCDSTKESGEIVALLEENSIPYKISDDALSIRVPEKYSAAARMALGTSGIIADAYTIDQALSGSFTTTEADKDRKYKLYLESTLEHDLLEGFDQVKAAIVQLNIPENDGTLLSKNEEPSAGIRLELSEDITPEQAENLAKLVATVLHCKNTERITIMDSQMNILYTGSDDESVSGSASSQLGVKHEAEKLINGNVKNVLNGTGVLGDIKVNANLIIDFSTTEKTKHDYTPAEGQSQGVLAEERTYTSESTGGTGGTPGTDSNTEITYQFRDNQYSNATVEELYRKYLPNEYLENTKIPPGEIKYGQSSLAISSTKYIVVKEDDVKAQGLLAGITWEEYQNANSERKLVEVSDDMVALASDASGIPKERISIVAYEENFFVDSEGANIDIYDIIQIALIVIILALLAVVVLKSMKQEKQPEEAEELSVESILQSNPEPVLDDIEVEEGSETKRLIEKFVDENPEAVANLLRNWLSEDWG